MILLLRSDLIGFQTYHDCRHFLSACTRILALDARPKGVEYHGHMVAVDIFPVGIDPEGMEKLLDDPSIKKRTEELRQNFAGVKLIMYALFSYFLVVTCFLFLICFVFNLYLFAYLFHFIRGRDRLDYIKGIPQKLLAFEDLMLTRPEWQGKVVLFQVCLPPTETVSHYYPSGSSENAQELHSQINE